MRAEAETVERCSEWREYGSWTYALGRDGIKQPLLLRRRPEADGPRVEAVACTGGWPEGSPYPEHDPDGWDVARLVKGDVAA